MELLAALNAQAPTVLLRQANTRRKPTAQLLAFPDYK
jgi:hypothetical protein